MAVSPQQQIYFQQQYGYPATTNGSYPQVMSQQDYSIWLQQQQQAELEQVEAMKEAQNKANDCTDGKDDGKIGFFSKIGNAIKGVGKMIGNAVEAAVKHPFKTLAMVGVCCIPVVGPVIGAGLAAYGLYQGGKSIVEGVQRANSATTDAEAKAAWQELGSGTFTVALSAVGLKSSVGALKSQLGGASSTVNLARQGLQGQTKLQFAKNIGKAAAKETGSNMAKVATNTAKKVRNGYRTVKNVGKGIKNAAETRVAGYKQTLGENAPTTKAEVKSTLKDLRTQRKAAVAENGAKSTQVAELDNQISAAKQMKSSITRSGKVKLKTRDGFNYTKDQVLEKTGLNKTAQKINESAQEIATSKGHESATKLDKLKATGKQVRQAGHNAKESVLEKTGINKTSQEIAASKGHESATKLDKLQATGKQVRQAGHNAKESVLNWKKNVNEKALQRAESRATKQDQQLIKEANDNLMKAADELTNAKKAGDASSIKSAQKAYDSAYEAFDAAQVKATQGTEAKVTFKDKAASAAPHINIPAADSPLQLMTPIAASLAADGLQEMNEENEQKIANRQVYVNPYAQPQVYTGQQSIYTDPYAQSVYTTDPYAQQQVYPNSYTEGSIYPDPYADMFADSTQSYYG